MHSLPSRDQFIEVLCRDPQNLLNVSPLGVSRRDSVSSFCKRNPAIAQENDDLDAGINRVHVPRFVIGREQLKYDTVDSKAAQSKV